MPRAFLLVKDKQGGSEAEAPNAPRAGQKRRRCDAEPELSFVATWQAALQSGGHRVEDFQGYQPVSGDEHRPSPTSSPDDYEPRSSPEPILESRPSPRDNRGFHGLVQTTGARFAQVDGVFDMSQKRPRLELPAPVAGRMDHLSPRSTTSDSALSDVSSSPGANDHYRYFLPRPSQRDRRSPLESLHDHKRDMVEPVSPLQHLVQRNSQHKGAAFPPGFGFPLPPLGMGFPGMANPMFLPHHFRPYPPMANTTQGPFRPREEQQPRQVEEKPEPVAEDKPSPRQRTSHRIEDLLARSPPKTKKSIQVPSTVLQHRPVPIVQTKASVIEVKPVETDSRYNNPMQKLVEMDKMLAQSPRNNPVHKYDTQSPKAGSYAPDMHAATRASYSKTKSIQRNLELSFQKQGAQSAYSGIDTVTQAMRHRQQQLVQNYDKLLQLQRTHEKLMQSIDVENESDKKERKSIECVPDINKNNCLTEVHELTHESVFPRRYGEEQKELLVHERLSPGLLENVPVDFTSTACPRKPGPPRFQCDGCKKSYSTLNGLSKHKEFHCVSHVKKEFSCKHCQKTYTSLGALKMHIRTHTLPCKCQICGKAFSRPWLLQGHIRTHTGEKPFSCQHCQRAFADRSNLRAHLQTHTDIKRYSCQTCSKTFSRMSLLTKHRENGCLGIH